MQVHVRVNTFFFSNFAFVTIELSIQLPNPFKILSTHKSLLVPLCLCTLSLLYCHLGCFGAVACSQTNPPPSNKGLTFFYNERQLPVSLLRVICRKGHADFSQSNWLSQGQHPLHSQMPVSMEVIFTRSCRVSQKTQLFSDPGFKLTNCAPVCHKYLGQIAFYLAQILSGDRSQVGQFKSWIRKKLRFLGHPKVMTVQYFWRSLLLRYRLKLTTSRVSGRGCKNGPVRLTVYLCVCLFVSALTD